jgi:hypothetical protein
MLERVSLVRVVTSLLTILPTTSLAETFVYYARAPVDGARIVLVGIVNDTIWEVRSLVSGSVVQEGTMSRLSVVQVSLTTEREFKVVTSQPVLAVLDLRSQYSGNYFYPQEDGRKYWGTRFVFARLGWNAISHVVFARDPAVVRVFDETGTQVAVSPTLSTGQSWELPGFPSLQPYAIQSGPPDGTSSASLISIMSRATQNGNTQVPPVAREAQGLRNDCNNDLGMEFFFLGGGNIGMFNPGSSAITFSLQTVTSGGLVDTVGYQDIPIAANSTFFNSSSNGFASVLESYRLTSTGPVALWVGQGRSISEMGDDVTNNFGDEGRSFLLSTQSGGATVFALEADTRVTYTIGGEPRSAELGVDGFLSIQPNQFFSLTANRPVSIMTLGGDCCDDIAVQLRPAQALDTDGNGIEDRHEGSSCTSIAPDTDGDGILDFQDVDDDNDCLYDVDEPVGSGAGRLDATIPNANADDNCSVGRGCTCDRTIGKQAACYACLSGDARVLDAGGEYRQGVQVSYAVGCDCSTTHEIGALFVWVFPLLLRPRGRLN